MADGTAERACYCVTWRTARRSVPATLGPATLVEKEDRRWCVAVVVAFPFAADFSQPVHAELEAIAQAVENFARRAIFGAGFDLTGDQIGSLSLMSIVNQMVRLLGRLAVLQRFRIESCPEQRKVADVPMDVSSCIADALLGFGHHVRDLIERSTFSVSHAEDGFMSDKSNQQVADVINDGRIDDSQACVESLLG